VSDRCTWCGAGVDADAGYRLSEGARRATFCRLEHVVPWAIRGAHWEPAEAELAPESLDACAWCHAPLDGVHVTLVRSRGEHRVPDAFCGVEHLLAWAKAGGRYRV
jgi:hypothetical protein